MDDDAADAKYWAFISYNNKDGAFARRLHRRLENYSLPRHLAGGRTALRPLPNRLSPIFLDRDELPAANDLSTEVQAALQASRSLIVVCSPAAAASKWVAREVELFRGLHPDRPILAAIREGEPAECMPLALRWSRASGEIVEPLAADFRRGGDGPQLGRLKLVAGILGVGLNELIQRDASRRLRSVMAVTAVALTAMLVMGALTILARNARADAERQRSEAEGLVEFMLTDLRDRLKGVGRLDVLTAVNERALTYYSDQDLDRLAPTSLERRARILHAMGEDDESRGDMNAALAKFQEAKRTTAALLAASPADPERIFAHAQTDFWIGSAYYERNNVGAATSSFLAYKALTDRLIAISPNNPKYRREAAAADEGLCVLALSKPRQPTAAIRYCSSALAQEEVAARHLGPASGIANDLTNTHAWLADAYRANGDLARAMSERLTEEKILAGQLAADPRNMDLKETWVATQRALAMLEKQAGDKSGARIRLDRALAVVDGMIAFDPKNQNWKEQHKLINDALSAIH